MRRVHRVGLALVCWLCFATSGVAVPSARDWQHLQEQIAAQKSASDEQKAENRDLSDRLKAQESALLEAQRKNIDWWLSAIGVGLTALGLVIAVGGVLVPLYWQRSERRRLSEAQAEFARMNAEAAGLLARLQSHEATGAKAAGVAQQHADNAEAITGQLRAQAQRYEPPPMKSTDTASSDEQGQVSVNAEAATAAQQLATQADATEVDKLRERAIVAARIDNPSDAQVHATYELWHALAVLDSQDSSAQFNSGYWAQVLYYRDFAPGRKHWFVVSQEHYDNRLNLKRDSHATAYNWGNVLKNEAQALKDLDLTAARALWKTAGEKYALALEIKPDKHEAANNWGIALDDEAQTLKDKDLAAARALWKVAGEKYALALEIKPDKHEAAYNWGNVLKNEAQALKDQDLDAARALWKAAGEKYALALEIKQDLHDAANNWGSALLHEFHALHADCGNERQGLLGRAERLLAEHSAMDDAGRDKCAYGLACVYSLQGRVGDAVIQLEWSRRAGALSSYWRTDPDLEPIRPTSEYQAWLKQNFSDE